MQARVAAGAAAIVSSHLLGQIDSLCSKFLILRGGESLFFGSRDEIRNALPGLREDASLEDIFFEITEGSAADES